MNTKRTDCQALLAVLLIASITTAGCTRKQDDAKPQGRDKIVIGVSLLNLSSEFIVMLDQAMRGKAKELDVTLIVNDAQRNPEKQVQQVESFVARGVSAIILNPCEIDASSPAVDSARAGGNRHQ